MNWDRVLLGFISAFWIVAQRGDWLSNLICICLMQNVSRNDLPVLSQDLELLFVAICTFQYSFVHYNYYKHSVYALNESKVKKPRDFLRQ
jgi:hypothetical protein